MEIPASLVRPFGRDDLAPVPPGWRVGPPDYVGVGCGKAGSSWWHTLVAAHPQVVPNRLRRKEVHYFPHFGWRAPDEETLATYREAFARPAGAVCGEWSGNYLYYPFALDALAAAAPAARLVALVRNPVDRFVSMLNQYTAVRADVVGASGAGRAALETWSLFPEAAYQARVADGVRRALELFGRERVLVLQYERCVEDTAGELARTYEFLGVDPLALPADLERPVNRRDYVVERPDAASRAWIARWFEDDVRALGELLPELELERWPDFAAVPSNP